MPALATLDIIDYR